PQIIVAVLMEVLDETIQKVIDIGNARPILAAKLATAKQPADLPRMLLSDEGEADFDSYWTFAMAGNRPPSTGTQVAIARAVDFGGGKLSLQPESSANNGMCIGFNASYVGIRPCTETNTAWSFNAATGEFRNNGQNGCL